MINNHINEIIELKKEVREKTELLNKQQQQINNFLNEVQNKEKNYQNQIKQIQLQLQNTKNEFNEKLTFEKKLHKKEVEKIINEYEKKLHKPRQKKSYRLIQANISKELYESITNELDSVNISEFIRSALYEKLKNIKNNTINSK